MAKSLYRLKPRVTLIYGSLLEPPTDDGVSDSICANERAQLIWVIHKQNRLPLLNLSCPHTCELCLATRGCKGGGLCVLQGASIVWACLSPPKFYGAIVLPKTSQIHDHNIR